MPVDEPESASDPAPESKENSGQQDESESTSPDRRRFVTGACAATMGGALLASYGTFFSYAGSYLYPSKSAPKSWLFVTQAQSMKVGDSLTYRTPAGAPVAIARQGDTGEVDDFIALSSQCPHLGCAVHWEGQNDRFFCPCHNGVFDPKGAAVSGPPADANQPLPRYPLKLEDGLLYIEVSTDVLPNGNGQHACNDTPTDTPDDETNGGTA